MLADDVNGSRGIGNPAANGLPGFTVVGCRENIDAVIVAAMPVEGGEGRALCGLRCRNTAHIGAFRHAGNFRDRKSTRLNSSHDQISYAVFCLNKKKCKFYRVTR